MLPSVNVNVTRFLQGYQVLVRRVSLERGVDLMYIAAAGGRPTYSYTGDRGSYSALQFEEPFFNVYANIQYNTVQNLYAFYSIHYTVL